MNPEDRATPTSPAEAEREAARTRAELADTLDALDHKLTNLTTRHLVEKGFNMIRDSLNNSDGLNRSLDIVRANPIPIALIGLGTAWLVASNTGVVDRIANDERIEAARRRVSDMASDLGNRAGSLASDMAGKIGMGGGDRPLGQTGNRMIDESGRDDSSGWVHQASDMAQGAVRSVRDSAMINRVSNFAGDGAGRIADQVSDAFERNPLVVGAVGLLAGALIAALLPATRFEDELVGTTRDELWEKAEDAGQDAISRVRDAATHAIDSATDAAADTIKGELGGASKS